MMRLKQTGGRHNLGSSDMHQSHEPLVILAKAMLGMGNPLKGAIIDPSEAAMDSDSVAFLDTKIFAERFGNTPEGKALLGLVVLTSPYETVASSVVRTMLSADPMLARAVTLANSITADPSKREWAVEELALSFPTLASVRLPEMRSSESDPAVKQTVESYYPFAGEAIRKQEGIVPDSTKHSAEELNELRTLANILAGVVVDKVPDFEILAKKSMPLALLIALISDYHADAVKEPAAKLFLGSRFPDFAESIHELLHSLL